MKTANGLNLADDLAVQESDTGIWFYHLTRTGVALCGSRRLFGRIYPVSHWGFRDGNVPYKYCGVCEKMALAFAEPQAANTVRARA